MIKIIIGIDIDGVVNDLSLFHIACGTKYCFENNILCNITNTCLDSTDIFKWPIYTDSNFWECYYSQLLQQATFIRPFVTDVTTQLTNEGHTIIFISSRKDQDLPVFEKYSMYQITKKYLDENGICYSKIILSQKKDEIIISQNIELMIEDNPTFFSQVGIFLNIPLLCFDTPYNVHVSGANITRVYSWYDILQKIHLIERN